MLARFCVAPAARGITGPPARRAMAGQVIATRIAHLQTYGLKLNVVALVDSSGAISDASGLTDAELSAAIAAKESGGTMKAQAKGSDVSLSALVNQVWRDPLIVVDCSATDATVGCALGWAHCDPVQPPSRHDSMIRICTQAAHRGAREGTPGVPR